MAKETRGKKEEIKQEIIVLDQGIDVDSLNDTRGICCYSAIFPLRG